PGHIASICLALKSDRAWSIEFLLSLDGRTVLRSDELQIRVEGSALPAIAEYASGCPLRLRAAVPEQLLQRAGGNIVVELARAPDNTASVTVGLIAVRAIPQHDAALVAEIATGQDMRPPAHLPRFSETALGIGID